MAKRTDPTFRRFEWDQRSLRYRDARAGVFVSEARIRSDLEAFAQAVSDRMAEGVRSVYAGTERLEDWQDRAGSLVRSLHLASAAVAVGGFNLLSRATKDRVAGILRFHLERLEAFAKDIADGRQSEAQAAQRATLYGRSAWGTWQNEGREQWRARQRRGFRIEERRVLSPAENCQTCVRLAKMNWQPIDSLPAIGVGTECGFNCRCRFEWREVSTRKG